MTALTVKTLIEELEALIAQDSSNADLVVTISDYDDWAIGASTYIKTIERVSKCDKTDADEYDVCFYSEITQKYVLIG